jgi:hypothetical protein
VARSDESLTRDAPARFSDTALAFGLQAPRSGIHWPFTTRHSEAHRATPDRKCRSTDEDRNGQAAAVKFLRNKANWHRRKSLVYKEIMAISGRFGSSNEANRARNSGSGSGWITTGGDVGEPGFLRIHWPFATRHSEPPRVIRRSRSAEPNHGAGREADGRRRGNGAKRSQSYFP